MEIIYEFGVGKSDTETTSGRYGVRHTIALVLFFAFSITYAMRTCLSVTIVAMVGASSTGNSLINISSNISTVPNISSESENNVREIEWDEKTRGLVRGSFFYGHVLTYCLGGVVADYWGGRYPFGISVIVSSILTLFSPYAGRHSSVLLICVRVMHGISEGLGYSSLTKIIAQWYPIQERSKFTAYIYSGYTFGILISMALSGWLCTIKFLGGWPVAFYLFGTLGLVCSVFWFIFVFEEPYKHPRITREELKYITQELPEIRDQLSVSWKSMLSSRYVWIICITNFGINWIEFIIMIDLPTYFDDVLGIDIQDNGLISAIPFLGSSIVSIAVGYIMNYFSSSGTISMISVRRMSIFISGYIPMIGFLVLATLDSNSASIVSLFVLMESFLGAASCSVYCSPADVAPRFAGTVFGFSYTFGIIPGFLAPTVTGFLLQYFETRYAWRIVFVIGALLSGIATTIYILFITTEIQPWNEPDAKDKTKQGQYRLQNEPNIKEEAIQGQSRLSVNEDSEKIDLKFFLSRKT